MQQACNRIVSNASTEIRFGLRDTGCMFTILYMIMVLYRYKVAGEWFSLSPFYNN